MNEHSNNHMPDPESWLHAQLLGYKSSPYGHVVKQISGIKNSSQFSSIIIQDIRDAFLMNDMSGILTLIFAYPESSNPEVRSILNIIAEILPFEDAEPPYLPDYIKAFDERLEALFPSGNLNSEILEQLVK